MCLSLLLFDSCLLWGNIALYLAGWLNYKFIQPSNQETIKQIVQSFQHQDTPFFLVEKFACTKTRLAITLSKLWHAMSLIRHDLNNSVILLVELTCFLIIWMFLFS